MVVVDEGPVEDHAAMRLEGTGKHVGCVGVSAAVGGGAEAAFGIGFHDEAGEIGNAAVDVIDFFAPPFGNSRIQGIKRVETADEFGTAEIDGQGKLHTPRSKRVGDAADLGDETIFEHAGGGV